MMVRISIAQPIADPADIITLKMGCTAYKLIQRNNPQPKFRISGYAEFVADSIS